MDGWVHSCFFAKSRLLLLLLLLLLLRYSPAYLLAWRVRSEVQGCARRAAFAAPEPRTHEERDMYIYIYTHTRGLECSRCRLSLKDDKEKKRAIHPHSRQGLPECRFSCKTWCMA